MLLAFFFSLREGLEAALILGIILGVLRKIDRRELAISVWWGVGIALVISLVVAMVLTSLGLKLVDPWEAMYEGITMLLAAIILTWTVFWMVSFTRNIKTSLESDVERTSRVGKRGLFIMGFITVLRDGVELALFLTASIFAVNVHLVLPGAVLGLAAAIFMGWIISVSARRINIGGLFRFMGILMVVFAAGMIAQGVREFIELGWLPSLVEHVWNVNPILSDQSLLGQVLKALVGYNPSPSLTEVLAYFIYLLAVVIPLLVKWKKTEKMGIKK